MTQDKRHWTDESIDDYQFFIFSDIVEQIEKKMFELNITVDELHNKLHSKHGGIVKPTLDHKFDDETFEVLILICRELGLHLSLVSYNNFEKNDKPLISQMFVDCWEAMGKPRDWFSLEETQGKEIKLPQRVLDNKKKRENNEI